ncbi:MAG: twin-arginine translocase TatA/TatE family subunit [Nitrospirota bacterium]|nr:twin-arginine translocase TatA/TatE family subunit [Nitrospirota bacterium]
MGIGTTELILILAVVMIIFGAGKLPEVGSALGKGIRGFKKSLNEKEEINITPTAREEERVQQEAAPQESQKTNAS